MSDTTTIEKVKQPLEKKVSLNGRAKSQKPEREHRKDWKSYEKIGFRVAFIFFISICIPNSLNWYTHLIHIDWFNLHYRDLYDIARFGSGLNFFGNSIFGNSLLGYANWIITLGFAIIGGVIWTVLDQKSKQPAKEYNMLYYWLRVIVRYRAGIGIIGFGFTKLLPVQMPYPSEGILNTDFGDFTPQKIFWLSIGIVPWYQIFSGVVEILAGFLLFFRGTAALGAALLIGTLGTITYVNFAYDGGVHVYASYFVLLGLFVLWFYIPRIYRLLILEKYTIPVNHYPSLTKNWQKYSRIFLKSATIIIFIGVFFYLQYVNFLYDPYKQPSTKGITELRGYYDVVDFKINGETIPYDPLSPIRWKDVTFEKWTTLTYKVNKPTPLDLSNGGGDPMRDINRTFEIAGVGGGTRVFHYFADTIENKLYLQDKYKARPDRRNVTAGAGGDAAHKEARFANLNEFQQSKAGIYADNWISKEAWSHIGDENHFIDPRAASTRRDREFEANKGKYDERKRMVLEYQIKDNGAQVILSGVNEDQDSLNIVLQRVKRDYVISKGELEAGKYE
ncbi:hypothetical protein U1E44_01970 [Arenibacter sp. GZD96]|uniref:hypothetical protein n=1 Tax=Aurantibrevibacter litoralis TaxID=3106030 RepID=UPI002AFFC11F|nr:hypothetical protein [Arenibacter sp. GZD-96]MEA1784846.1 hypothetical protein [Arenibacter sp. GZD-96]